MKHFSDTVLKTVTGGLTAPAVGASVQVNITGGLPAQLFSDDGITAKSNPVITDANGRYDFYVADGRYDLQISGIGLVTFTLTNVEIADVTQGAASDVAWVLGGGSVEANLTPRLLSLQDGTLTAPILTATTQFPTMALARYEGTPNNHTGFNWYGLRATAVTASGVDVQSGVTAAFLNEAFSTNSLSNYNNTNQVALVANCSAMNAAASTSCFGANIIATTAYTGNLPQQIVGQEIDLLLNRTGQQSGSNTGPWAVGLLVHNNSAASSITDGTYGVLVEGVDVNDSFKHAGFFSGRSSGITIGASNSVTPDTGLYIRNATTYGIWIGGGSTPESGYDQNKIAGNPAVGFALGEQATISGFSNKIRFRSTNASGTVQNYDAYTDTAGALHFNTGPLDGLIISASGYIQLNANTFGALIAANNGTITYCSDCTIANPCAGGGTGAFAKRLNGVWVCN